MEDGNGICKNSTFFIKNVLLLFLFHQIICICHVFIESNFIVSHVQRTKCTSFQYKYAIQ